MMKSPVRSLPNICYFRDVYSPAALPFAVTCSPGPGCIVVTITAPTSSGDRSGAGLQAGLARRSWCGPALSQISSSLYVLVDGGINEASLAAALWLRCAAVCASLRTFLNDFNIYALSFEQIL